MAKKNTTKKADLTSTPIPDRTTVTTDTITGRIIEVRPSLGYAQGYGKYTSKTSTHTKDGTTIEIISDKGNEEIKSVKSDGLFLDIHTEEFRSINGYGDKVDYHEDPTFLIFDVKILTNNNKSPLFSENNGVSSYINEYSKFVPELAERVSYLTEFINRLTAIFPTDDSSKPGSGKKRHYIESIGNLDVLLSPIINYPEDIITFQITEDIAMNLQYLAELYNNLVYSYESHRYLIPDNLFRFNMRITISDIRDMKNKIV